MLKPLLVLFSLVFLFPLTVSSQSGIPAQISGDVNLRTGPGTAYEVITIMPHASTVTLLGRDDMRTWLYADYNGQTGWFFYRYVVTEGSILSLPIVTAGGVTVSEPDQQQPVVDNAEPSTADAAPSVIPVAVPVSGTVVSGIGSRARQIFAAGQAMGNRADVFSKVGDSITASDLFLDPIGHGAYMLGDYAYLQPVIDYYSQTGLRDHYSFANTSLAARGGFTTSAVLDPSFAVPGICQPGETPLACEYRTSQPAVALIMLGTNDVALLDEGTFQTNLTEIVNVSAAMGVIPVLSTIPERPNSPVSGRVAQFNRIITAVAITNGVPLWDYHGALQGLHNDGLSEDNVHPSYDPSSQATAHFVGDGLGYGYNVRNLTALQVLDAIWRQVLR